MFNGKMKAVTFSYDDGITQDQRFIKILNKYGLKCTFNINSELLGKPGSLIRNDVTVAHVKPRAEEVANIYRGHEVAVHTLTHPFLPGLDDKEVIRQVEQDRINLSEIVGYEVVGMAYPCGGENNDDRVAKLIKENTGVKYSRTIKSSDSFDLQDNLYRFNPTVYHMHHDRMMELGREFIELKPDTPKLFYIWGHTYEFDFTENGWERFEEFCKLISNKDDIYYCTNKEAFGF
ncbi:MAG: polysaccharide deacetylase family protein [Clostridia bacterium]|nr:polysaccharide deacetylase family protein [Clostridia bacterium]